MSWFDLKAAIKAAALADTGTGGLFKNGSDALIKAFYVEEVPYESAQFPFAMARRVVGLDDNVFNANVVIREYTVQFDVVTRYDWPESKHEAIVERLETVFRRIQLTVTGWTVSEFRPENRNLEYEREGDVHRTSLDMDVSMSKINS